MNLKISQVIEKFDWARNGIKCAIILIIKSFRNSDDGPGLQTKLCYYRILNIAEVTSNVLYIAHLSQGTTTYE